jgi:hypothetical protein
MLLLNNARTLTVDGVTVYPDHVDKNQFWCLPAPVGLARRGPDKDAQLTFIGYRSATPGQGEAGGGFLMFEVNLAIEEATRTKILAAVRPLSDGEPRLSTVQFDAGTVKCVALDLEGSGGTAAPVTPPGTFRAVESILGAKTPSLAGEESAAFSLQLSKDGAIIVRKAFEQGTAPIGVIYELRYTGLRPALNVTIEADMERVYNHFSASIEGHYAWLKGSIEAALDFLRQQGAIKVTATNFVDAGDKDGKEKEALDFFTKNLLKDWFQPTFTPAEASSKGDGTSAVDKAVDTAGKIVDAAGKVVDAVKNAGSSDKSSTDKKGAGDGDKSASKTAAATATAGATAAAARPAAVLEITEPKPLPDGVKVTHEPAAEGLTETVKITAPNATVTVDDVAHELTNGTLTVDVAESASVKIEITIPGETPTEETFDLFFDYDRPSLNGFSALPPSAEYRSYLDDAPKPADARFSTATHAPSGDKTATGAAALRNWIRDRVTAPETVTIHATASFEGHVGAAGYNRDLSMRRMVVAKGIIGSLAQVTKTTFTGQDETKQEPPEADPQDRVAHVTAMVGANRPAVVIKATLSRGAATKTEDPPADDKTDDKDNKDDKDDKDKDNKDKGDGDKKDAPSDPAGLSFKLKFVHQDERKKVTVIFDRTEATQRIYAPQGFFGMLLNDLADKSKHFVEVDLDDPFFRQINVTAAAPLDFAAIGLSSAQVAIDYGDPADAANHRHADFVFDAAHRDEQKTSFFLNANHDTTYTHSVQFHFDPASGWLGRRDTVERPATVTSDRTLLLNPHEDVGFLDVKVVPGRIDEKLVVAVDAELSHRFSDGHVISQTLRVAPTSAEQRFRVRTEERDSPQYEVRLTNHLVDGTTHEQPVFTSSIAALAVDDMFQRPLEIDLVAVLDPATTRSAIVDVEYDDDANNYHRAERVSLVPGKNDPVHVHLALMNPDLRTYRFRTTVIGTDGQFRQSDFASTQDTLVVVH